MLLNWLQNWLQVTDVSLASSVKMTVELHVRVICCDYLMKTEKGNDKSGYHIFSPELISDSGLDAIT